MKSDKIFWSFTGIFFFILSVISILHFQQINPEVVFNDFAKSFLNGLKYIGYILVFVFIFCVCGAILCAYIEYREAKIELDKKNMIIQRENELFRYQEEQKRLNDQIEYEKKLITIEKLKTEVFKDRVSAAFHVVDSKHGLVFRDVASGDMPQYFHFHLPQASKPAQVSAPIYQQIETQTAQSILPILSEIPRIWLVGGQGSGKTSLMNHLADLFLHYSDLIVLDTHDQPGKWPQGARVFGGGRDYEGVAYAMKWLLELMQQRYQEYFDGKPEQDFKKIRIIADEWTSIPRKLPDQVAQFSEIFTEGRKVGIDYCFASHSDRVGKTGFAGCKDIFDEIDAVAYLKNDMGQRYALLNGQKYQHPGPYLKGRSARFEMPETFETQETPKQEPFRRQETQSFRHLGFSGFSEQDQKIYDLAMSGMSRGKIAKEVKMQGAKYRALQEKLNDWGL
jgi:energy-coupling factor transporter ATP-binding protein EcfA2